MISCRLLALALLTGAAAGALAVEVVGVRGSDTRFTTTMEATLAGKPVKLVLTGTALRQKYFLNVYAIASYLQEGASARTPEDLAAVDSFKRLHLVLERAMEGKDLAEAFRAAVRLNYPEPAFAGELNELAQLLLEADQIQKGDHIYLTHLPGIGLNCQLAGTGEHLIKNPQFSRAVWDIYLGKNNVGEAIKKGLVSRLR